MDGLIDDVERAFSDFSWTNVLEIAAIAVVMYAALRLLRGTTAMSVVRGMVMVVLAIIVLGRVIDSVVLDWIVDNALAVLLIVVLLVFQPEFRRAFEHVGRAGGLRGRINGRQPYRDLIPMVSAVAGRLSRGGLGALFIFERQTGLEELADMGVRMGASPTPDLLESVFTRGSPLHDGAVLLRPGVVVAAAVIVPTPTGGAAALRAQEAQDAGVHLGTRHRAAMVVTEDTDAVAVVVSEENGAISLVQGGELRSGFDADDLEAALSRELRSQGWGMSARGRRWPASDRGKGAAATGL